MTKEQPCPDEFLAKFGIGVAEGMIPMKKIFLDDGNQAVMACSNCFKTSPVSGADYQAVEGMVKIRLQCECGASDAVILERRKYFRKEVRLPGIFMEKHDDLGKPVQIQNLSVTGMAVRLSDSNGVRIGDKITVEFQAGPDGDKLIRKDAVIRHIEGDLVGMEFSGDIEYPDSQTICSLIFA